VADHGDDDARQTIASTIQQTSFIVEQREEALIESVQPGVPRKPNRKVYDAAHRRTLPGRLLMSERKNSSKDLEAAEAFNGSGATYDFYSKVFARDSIDDHAAPISSTIHYGVKFDNAMWDGKQMIYGDGDGKLFNRFTIALDVIGHELTHGVTQHSAVLEYQGQSGALNEHLSDVFGILVKQYTLGQTAGQSDWIIGGGLFTDRVKGIGVRSMKAPGTAYDDAVLGRDPQPAHMRDFVRTPDDHGGVHINSGIPNRAFYLAATAIGGYAWEIPGQIWYLAATKRIGFQSKFNDMAGHTIAVAGQLFGVGGQVQHIVAEAWATVGIYIRFTTTPRLPIARDADTPKWRTRPLASIANRNSLERKN
jgi:Zn-dependent metalloprotease